MNTTNTNTNTTNPIPTDIITTTAATQDKHTIIFRFRERIESVTNYHVCYTACWQHNLFPYVENELKKQGAFSATQLSTAIHTAVVSWLVRYKYRIILIPLSSLHRALVEGRTPREKSKINASKKVEILVRDIETVLAAGGTKNVFPDADEEYIRNFPGSTILISYSTTPPHAIYEIVRNSGYLNLLGFINRNSVPEAKESERKCVIFGWMTRYQGHFRYEDGAKPLCQFSAIHLLDEVVQLEATTSVAETSVAEAGVSPKLKVKYGKCSHVKLKTHVKSQVPFGHSQHSTRLSCAKLSKYLVSASRSKNKIDYTANAGRHSIGQLPKLKRLPTLMYCPMEAECDVDKGLLGQRVLIIAELEAIHSALIHLGIYSPRDRWEEWIDNFKMEKDCDPPFMCLLIILMSSSTSDNQLAEIIPRLFSSGMTSAKGVIEIVQTYGQDCFCSLLSELGRYYQNTERILNAADYFVQRHNGRIPCGITILELCTLFGVGYKTANIVLTTAFRRVEGIPSDIHVIRWSSILGWCNSTNDGLKCSKNIEGWLPKSMWESINPLFGAFGQLLVSDQRQELMDVALQHPSPEIRKLFTTAARMYRNNKK
jgi:endonuclease III